MPDFRPLIERLEGKYIKAPSGCWQWVHRIDNKGYGRYSASRSIQLAHRAMLIAHGVDLPADMDVDHLCRNRACVNPLHLDVVTHRVNCLRGVGFSAVNARKTKCANGHEYTPENTRTYYENGNLRRKCRICAAASDARRWRAKKAANEKESR